MSLSRRHFLSSLGAGALGFSLPRRLLAAPTLTPPTPVPDARALIDHALEAARAAGASYADARVEVLLQQSLAARDDHLVRADENDSRGIGIRVLSDGIWGFAATFRLDPDGVAAAARQAVAVARGSHAAARKKVELPPAPSVTGRWVSPMELDPFAVPLGEKVEALLKATRAALALPGARIKSDGSFVFVRQIKTFGSTEGSATEQIFYRSLPTVTATAIDAVRGEFEPVDTDGFLPPAQAGYERVTHSDLPALSRRAAEIAVARLGASPVEPGRYDLVLAPSNLWLTIHESVGHPTELDRALGYEANLAGTSFATPEQLGRLRYGSELVHVVADRTQKGGLATCAWDDDGVAADRWDLVRKGVLVGFQTTREQAPWLHEAHGHATSYAESWSAVPFQRMPNVSLLPGDKRLTPEELIADTKHGIYLEGRGSWSIDQRRHNFQFSAQRATLIEGGKLIRPVRYAAYQSSSVDFWRACDAICDERDYWLGGTLNDGKGEPVQANAVSHGCATARFRGINILNSRSAA